VRHTGREHKGEDMSVTRQGRLKRAAALVPLALLSAAWTVSISTTGAPQATAGGARPTLPDGTSLPADALQVPASVSTPDGAGLGATGESATQIVSASSASAIPSAALAAYQRAETVINKADPTCHLPWQLLAAIGRIESNHGRANGNQLDTAGIARPGVLGVALDGASGTSKIVDTDGGRYDGDTAYDRAVGPMQFIPSTWSTVGVDADGDGQRDPQDINDAALAAAVYLCSGDEDLSTSTGQSTAVYRYNHSASYVATVLAVMQSYLAGDYTAAPNATIPANYFEPDPVAASQAKHKKAKKKHHAGTQPGSPGSTATAPSAPHSSAAPSSGSTPGAPKPPKPSSTPTVPLPPVSVPTTGVTPVDQVLTLAQATAQCTIDLGIKSIPNPLKLSITDLLKPLGLLDDWNTCIKNYTT
jgi:membrane-bound lytic murein transglycosylase B